MLARLGGTHSPVPATRVLHPSACLGKGLSRGKLGMESSFGAHAFAPDSALFMREQHSVYI